MSILKSDQLDINGWCFACGEKNPHGLHMQVENGAEDVRCRITLAPHHQGWVGIAHGGIVATLMDEIMAHAVLRFAGHGVTTGMEIRYRSPVNLGELVEVRGWVAENRRRLAVARAEIRQAEGDRLLAEATAKFMLRPEPAGEGA
ncbi:MAG: PaaI family thioesterase [Deltaproteobacteria bacterium]|nr:PaaI family thioesterase [Deltaproteobacteria bacterium]